jgi:predicted enzyme related to lactoylglutathione lyase
MKKVTGIGGIFFTAKDPAALNEWYQTHLGINIGPYGASFIWKEDEEETASTGMTQWTIYAKDTDYFAPSQSSFMINYRVHDLEALVAALKSAHIPLLDEIATYDYGKFVHLLDPEGNKIELWQPMG